MFKSNIVKKTARAAMLTAALAASVFSFAACGGIGDGGGAITVRTALRDTELKIVFAAENTPKDYTSVVAKINNRLAEDGKPYKVKFEFISFTNYMTNVESKAKDGYDAAWVHIDNIPDMLSKGVIKKDIKPYLDEWGQKIYDDVPDYAFSQVTSLSGAVYAIPRHAPMANDREILMVRKDWMTAAGLQDMTTLDEFDEYLAYINNPGNHINNNASFAAHIGQNDFLLREYAPDYYFPYYDGQKRPVYIDITDSPYKVKSFYQTQNFLDMAEKARFYYDAGYLPTTSITNQEDFFNQGYTGGFIEFSVLKMTERIDTFKAVNRDADLYDFFIGNGKPKVVFRGVDNLVVALANSKNTEELADFISWTKNQDNYDLTNYGVKGVNYYLTADGKLTFVDPDSNKEVPDDKRFLIHMPYWAFNDIDYMRFSVGLTDEYIDSIKNWEGVDEGGTPNYIVSPLSGFNVENTAAYQAARSKVSAVDEVVNNIMRGTTAYDSPAPGGAQDRTVYEKLIADLYANGGMSELIAEVQKQLDAYLATKK
jgi:hypothetical protein